MHEPPDKSLTDKTDELVKAGLESLPLGGLLGYAYSKVMKNGYERRLNSWHHELADVVRSLEERYGDLASNELLIDAVVNATRAAQATHQREKIEALRNAVRNSVAPSAPDADEQARFFRLIEQFSAAHLRILAFLRSPEPVFAERGLPVPAMESASLGSLLEIAFPYFADQRDWYELLLDDLLTARLVISHNLVRPGWQPTRANALADDAGESIDGHRLSNLGECFVAFVLDGPDA